METKVNEKIRVVSLFEKGEIKPLLFSWRNRNYKIIRTVFAYSKDIGREKVFYPPSQPKWLLRRISALPKQAEKIPRALARGASFFG